MSYGTTGKPRGSNIVMLHDVANEVRAPQIESTVASKDLPQRAACQASVASSTVCGQ